MTIKEIRLQNLLLQMQMYLHINFDNDNNIL